MNTNVDVVIMAGGGGTRLWPVSRPSWPKQFLEVPNQTSLLGQAFERAKALTTLDRIWIVTVALQVQATREVLPHLDPAKILAEPVGRNSGPAVASATFYLQAYYQQPTSILFMPADSYIPNLKSFNRDVRKGIERAKIGSSLVTFGLKVREPRTDFGYIEVKAQEKGSIKNVNRFVEKPNFSKAKAFMRSGKHFWNSGIFAWRSDLFLGELKKSSPNIYGPLSKMDWNSPRSWASLSEMYLKLPNISVDYAVMEKSKVVEVVPVTFAWSDVGTWDAIYETMKKDRNKNARVGTGITVESDRNFLYSKNHKLVLFGVNDLVVVHCPDATLVTTRAKSKELKKLLEKMS